MEKENIEVYNLTVVELESRELSKSEAEIATDENFTNSIANIAENAIEKLKSMCNEIKFGLRKNENGTISKLAIRIKLHVERNVCPENETHESDSQFEETKEE